MLPRLPLAAALVLLAAATGAAAAQSAPRLRQLVVHADDGHPLAVWQKRPVQVTRGAVLLLHGRTWSARPNFDLHVGRTSHSTMDALAAMGFDVYALDQRGYGASARDSSGWLTPNRAADDASEVLDWIAARSPPGAARPLVVGYSQGTRTGMLAALRHPGAMRALVMYGFAVDVTRTRPPSAGGRPAREATTAAAAAEDFITPESTPPGVREAYVREALTRDPVRTDWTHDEQFNALDPAALRVPVLILAGERDPVVADAHPDAFWERLRGIDRAWVVLSDADHVAHLERPQEWVRAVASFADATRGRRAAYRAGRRGGAEQGASSPRRTLPAPAPDP